MSVPTALLNRFDTVYDGFPALMLECSNEVHNVELALRQHQVSYLMKIAKTKVHGKKRRRFILMLVEE